MWEINSTAQWLNFLQSINLGGALALIFGFFRLDRSVNKRTAFLVFCEDVFCFFISGIATFCFLILKTKGEIRFYILFGELVGFLSVTFLLSKILKFIALFLKKIKSRFQKVWCKFIRKCADLKIFPFKIPFCKKRCKKSGENPQKCEKNT